MNREIKFRVWDKGREQMWYKDTKSVDGNETILQFFAAGIGWGLYDSRLGNRLVTGDPNAIFNTPGILMQYTGLKDKKGKEIYEGDIWKERISTINGFVEVTFTIVYDDEYAAFAVMVDSNEEDTREINRPWANEVEIVGNIYETPHLLNSEQSVKESDTTKAT